MTTPRTGHRRHAAVRREKKKEVLYTSEELAMVVAAATEVGLRPGAFIAAVSVHAAKSHAQRRQGSQLRTSAEVQELTGELRELRRLLGNVAGNLNDVARHANSTGELGGNADAVLHYTRRMNERIDRWLIEHLRQTI